MPLVLTFPISFYMFAFATIVAGFRILTHVIHKEFRFYLAKGYCITATKKEDEFDKTRNLSLVLDSYNKYLRRRSHIEIKDIKRIYGVILMADIKEKNQMIKSICESLEGDKLKLARYLSSVCDCSNLKNSARLAVATLFTYRIVLHCNKAFLAKFLA